jgi:hypothetical protein
MYACVLCSKHPPFATIEEYNMHMHLIHGIILEQIDGKWCSRIDVDWVQNQKIGN